MNTGIVVRLKLLLGRIATGSIIFGPSLLTSISFASISEFIFVLLPFFRKIARFGITCSASKMRR